MPDREDVLIELQSVAARIGDLEHQATETKKRRDRLIVMAADKGASEREIARAAGVSSPRVHQVKERTHGR